MESRNVSSDQVIEVRTYPDPVLRKKCEPVEAVTERETELFREMVSIMQNSKGIGLAAPQIGVPRQLIIADIGKGLVRLANPVILKAKGKEKMDEGCLSVPGIEVDIKRSYEVVVGGLDENGRRVEVRATGLMARVLQHEIDHLRGKLIVDYIGLWKKIGLLLRRKRIAGTGERPI